MVFEKIKGILCDQLDIDEDSITMDSVITEDFGADSLDFVDLVMTLEEEFEVEFPDDEIKNIRTVGDLVKYIEQSV
jgi:acyl carrier protein